MFLNILVCIKQVPDSTEILLDDNNSLVRDFISQIINPADESALELALALKDKHGGSVSVMTMGKKKAEGMLRETASRGVDTLYLLNDRAFAGADTLATSRTLHAAIQKTGPFDLILCGRRSTDGETGQVGPELAALLNIPILTNATKFKVEKENATILRLLEEGIETLTFSLPAVVTICEWSYPLRLPTILGLKRARVATIQRFRLSDLTISHEDCGLKGSPTRVTRVMAQTGGIRYSEKTYDAIAGADKVLEKVR